jgi:hypothetical protein
MERRMMTKVVKLSFDTTSINLGEEEKKMSSVDLSVAVITNVMTGYANQMHGLPSGERKQYFQIKDMLDEAMKNQTTEIELENSLVGFLRKCFRETKLTPNNILRKVEENIDAIKDR